MCLFLPQEIFEGRNDLSIFVIHHFVHKFCMVPRIKEKLNTQRMKYGRMTAKKAGRQAREWIKDQRIEGWDILVFQTN